MFIGRDNEIGILNRHYKSDDFEFITIYGRRRVGKTTLIAEFCKGKKTILFPALETSAGNNLASLSSAIFTSTNPEMETQPYFDSFQQAFDYIAEYAKNERVIFVIDEFPYLAESDRSVSSILQHTIDHKFKNKTEIIVGSCKYRNETTALGVLTELKEYAAALGSAAKSGRYKKTYYYIFSKGSFSSALVDTAKSDPLVRLVPLDELYS